MSKNEIVYAYSSRNGIYVTGTISTTESAAATQCNVLSCISIKEHKVSKHNMQEFKLLAETYYLFRLIQIDDNKSYISAWAPIYTGFNDYIHIYLEILAFNSRQNMFWKTCICQRRMLRRQFERIN